jgi:hypothetical protein
MIFFKVWFRDRNLIAPKYLQFCSRTITAIGSLCLLMTIGNTIGVYSGLGKIIELPIIPAELQARKYLADTIGNPQSRYSGVRVRNLQINTRRFTGNSYDYSQVTCIYFAYRRQQGEWHNDGYLGMATPLELTRPIDVFARPLTAITVGLPVQLFYPHDDICFPV